MRGFLHGSAALAAGVGAIVLWNHRPENLSGQVSLLVFAFSLIGLYTVSSLYHSIPWRPRWKARMQRVDHAMIYVLIAGTYTPLVSFLVGGWLRWAILGTVWGIALTGILQKAFLPRVGHWVSITLQTTQGWLAVPLLVLLAGRLPWPGVMLMAGGGVLYTVGMVFLVTERPRLWPHVFSYHEVFHVCVVAASTAHWVMTFRYVANC